MTGKLYLIPNTIGSQPDAVIPPHVKDITLGLTYFIVENLRTTRRYLKELDKSVPIDNLNFALIEKHQKNDYNALLSPIIDGQDGGLISEAGLPAIADPGTNIVRIAHKLDIQVIPLTGPSSIFLALMASGLNGQNFAFKGYLPRPSDKLVQTLKRLESDSRKTKAAFAFIEAPYRNTRLIDVILKTLSPSTYLSVSHSLTTTEEWINTTCVGEWNKIKLPDLHKKPAIFIIQAES